MVIDMSVLINILTFASTLIVLGYKFGLIERQLERAIISSEEKLKQSILHLDNHIHELKTKLLLLENSYNKEDQINYLKLTQCENEIKQDLELIKLQVKQISKIIEPNGSPKKIINKDTTP